MFCMSVNDAGMVFSSGLGATTAITHMLKSGDHIVAMNDLYGGMSFTYAQLNQC